MHVLEVEQADKLLLLQLHNLKLCHSAVSWLVSTHASGACNRTHAMHMLSSPSRVVPCWAVLLPCCAVQLNMAALEVTRLHGLPVIDLGGMVFGLEPQQYLVDQHHPNKVRARNSCGMCAVQTVRQHAAVLCMHTANTLLARDTPLHPYHLCVPYTHKPSLTCGACFILAA